MSTSEKYLGNSKLLGVPSKRLTFQVKNKSITVDKLGDDVMNLIYSSEGSGGSGVKAIDLAQRMSSPNTVTDLELKTSIFTYGLYDRISEYARVVYPDTLERYLLFKVCYADSSRNYIDYIAYTTTNSISEHSTWVFNRIIKENDDDYPWAMTVFADILVDYENNILSMGNNKLYQLAEYEDTPKYTYEYGSPIITNITYGTIDGIGGDVYPSMSFSQAVTKTTTTIKGGSKPEYFTLKGTLEYNNGNKIVSYNNKSLITKGEASFAFENSGTTTLSNAVVMPSTGRVIAGASTLDTKGIIITVGATVTINGKISSLYKVGVYQEKKVDTTPIIYAKYNNADVHSLSFEGYTNKTYTKSIIVKGTNLTSDISVSLSGDSNYTVNTPTISKDSVSSAAGYELVITYAPNAISEYKLYGDVGVLTLSSTGAEDITVNLTGRAVHPTSMIIPSETTINGTAIVGGDAFTKIIKVNGENLTNSIEIDNKDTTGYITVSPTTISVDDAARGAYVTITYKPTVGGTHNANIKFFSMVDPENDESVTKYVSFKGTANVPTLGVSSASLTFSDVSVGSTKSTSINITGANLLGDVAVSKKNSSEIFHISATSIPKADVLNGTAKLTITYTPDGKSTTADTDTITISSKGATSVVVSVRGTYVNETVAVSGISLDKSTLSITKGGTATLVATVSPSNATDKTISWTTSNSSIATVSNGVVTAVETGEATITATCGEHSATCVITIVSGGSLLVGQVSTTLSGFAAMEDDDVVALCSEIDVASGVAASGTVAGVDVSDCYELNFTATENTFFMLVPGNVTIKAAKLIQNEMTSTSTGEDIQNTAKWRATHTNITVNDVEYNVYGYRDRYLSGAVIYIYAK